MATKKGELSNFQHGCIGACVGSIEQTVMRPAVFWKAELQQQRFVLARAVDPRFCYRGLPVAVASIAPITCIQFSATNACMNAIKRRRGGSTANSDADKFISGCFAGVASSLVQSPFQLVEVNQQNSGGSVGATARRVFSTYGFRGFFRGLSMTAMREGIFCSSYIALAPTLKTRLRARRPEMSDGTAVAASAILAGSFGAALSHPFDTMKTCLQGSLFPAQDTGGASAAARFHRATGPWSALRDMRQQGPLRPQVFRGFTPRVFRIVCCTYIYSTMTETFENLCHEWARSETSFGLGIVSGIVPIVVGTSAVHCEEQRARR
mmetsp:Transcript_21533/g.73812  ORF Transcript_21533/g.73812 Transcript_21533/m.73812 type:complete len:322 (+) Transcript_21533:101-1066(+)